MGILKFLIHCFRMPLSAAEKMRRYRERLRSDPDKRAEMMTKERDRWHNRRNNNGVTLIGGMTDRGKRLQRKKWRV